MRRLPISCFIIAKDEADRIGRTIESVQPWVNEVIVVDSGSTDDTMAVAIRAGARAISNAWPGFGQQKRFAEDQCTNDWLLNIDADEVVTPELCREIEALFANGSPPSRRLRNAGSIGLSWSVEAKAVGPRPLVHPPVRSPRRSLSRVGSAQFGRDRQSSVRKTSGCPAPLFDALVWRHETQVERADMAFGRACRASFKRRTYPTLVDRNADELPQVLYHATPFYRWLDGAAVRFDPLMVSIFENLSRVARKNVRSRRAQRRAGAKQAKRVRSDAPDNELPRNNAESNQT